MDNLKMSERISILKDKMLSEPRYASIEQALIITETYKNNENKPRIIQRALALKNALLNLKINAEPEEMIVGNRTAGVRYGVVFPESGSTWVDKEFETLPVRPQDKFNVREEDIKIFREIIKPYWEGKSLEDVLKKEYGKEINEIAKVVKINQKDHAQGHICPNCEKWLKKGPAGIKAEAEKYLETASGDKKDFYESVIIVMEGVQQFMMRYWSFLLEKAETEKDKIKKENMILTAENCKNISSRPAENFHEAVQSLWFLFVVLHMESNASSFSPGRMDSFLYPYYKKDIEKGILTNEKALEIIECLWLKFNEIVYMRNSHSAKYFAGFPIGFNIAVGGQNEKGEDFVNELSFLFLKAQEHLGLPQPNLSVRLHKGTKDKILKEAIKVVAKGSGMPQFFNDEAVIPTMEALGISEKDARNYAIVGCVELTTQGNNLGWSDAAMFNLNKILELTLNGGKCLLTGEQLSENFGDLTTYKTFEELEKNFEKHLNIFMDKMVLACEKVEEAHINLLPSPFLSSVIDNCIEEGKDVTQGGAKYNFSGIQMIQVANLADSLWAVKKLVFDEKKISKEELLSALRDNFKGHEITKAVILNRAEKYGNDIDEVDMMGVKWAEYFKKRLENFRNYRGGLYHTGMYTVSAHVPMGENLGASPDGRLAEEPLADGGMSPVYGRDIKGPTAVLKSVSKIDKKLTSNGGLLNMKFLPEFFRTETGIDKFANMMRGFVDLEYLIFNLTL